MRPNVAMLSLWKHNHAWFLRRLKNTTTDAAQCRYAFVVERQSCMISTKVEKDYDRCGPMSLCFRCVISTKVEKQHDRCGPMSLCVRCGNTILQDFYEGWKTPRPMRPNVAMLSLWKYNPAWFLRRLKNITTDAAQCCYAFVVEIQSCTISKNLKNTTTDAAQCLYACVVEIQSCMFSTQVDKHHDRCGPLSLCFRFGNTSLHDFYEFEKHHDRCSSMSTSTKVEKHQ
jgi:hypothetical protein